MMMAASHVVHSSVKQGVRSAYGTKQIKRDVKKIVFASAETPSRQVT